MVLTTSGESSPLPFPAGQRMAMIAPYRQFSFSQLVIFHAINREYTPGAGIHATANRLASVQQGSNFLGPLCLEAYTSGSPTAVLCPGVGG